MPKELWRAHHVCIIGYAGEEKLGKLLCYRPDRPGVGEGKQRSSKGVTLTRAIGGRENVATMGGRWVRVKEGGWVGIKGSTVRDECL